MYDELIKTRQDRAAQYAERTRDQQKWYSSKAGKNKKAFQLIGIAIVMLGALVGIIPTLFGDGPSSVDRTVAILGALIVILKGAERIWLPEEKWINYRKASEALLREKEKYVECLSPYNDNDDEDETYKRYVERCILIKAEEQNNFWGLGEGDDKSNDDVNASSPNNQEEQK